MTDITTKLAEALRLLVAAHELGVFLARGGLEPAREVLRLYEQATAQPVQDLPPLPEPVASQQLRRHNISGHERWFGFDAINPPHDKAHYAMVAARPRDLYTADQMHAYARAGYIAGLEAAASAIEPKCIPEDWTEYAGDCASLARVIRNLKEKA